MRYWVRVFVGVGVGGIAFPILWSVLANVWIGAAAAAVLAPLVFLATFFIWDADRPEDGYEQVLFDKPNSAVAAGLVLCFLFAGYAAVWTGYGEPAAAPTPRELSSVAGESKSVTDAFRNGGLDAETAASRLTSLRAEAERISPSEARDALLRALDTFLACVAGEAPMCDAVTARWVEYRAAV